MKAKNSLKHIEKYKKVYIENDYAPETRNSDTNLRTILKEIGKDKQYRVAGGKFMRSDRITGITVLTVAIRPVCALAS